MKSKSSLISVALIACALAFPQLSTAQGMRGYGPKKRLAVTDLLVTAGDNQPLPHPVWDKDTDASVEPPPIPADLGAGVTDMLINELVKTKRYLVIDETKAGTSDMQKEQALAGTKGGTLPAQLMVTGAITDFRWNKSSMSESLLDNYQRHDEGLGAIVRVDITIKDLATGEIIRRASAVGIGKGKASVLNVGTKFSSRTFKDCPLGEAVRNAIANAVTDIDRQDQSVPWEGRVADVVNDEGRGTEIYVNAGESGGVKVGDVFEITRRSGSTRSHVGRAKVVQVDADTCIVTPTDGEGFAVGDTVTFVSGPK